MTGDHGPDPHTARSTQESASVSPPSPSVASPSAATPLVAIARFTPLPEAYDRVFAALERVTIATHDEPGCMLLALHTTPNGQLIQIGKWESLDLWTAHGDAQSVQNLNREIEGLLAVPREIIRLSPVAVGDARGLL
ncbi:putative quinol monooxygenase [Plantibacter sp. Mn2098]|uniref:putative quinol monooxygenase n=1 Tax=Plantibacter sp. Mn2098 TaxID=3395266 RepID=UPI003BBF4029